MKLNYMLLVCAMFGINTGLLAEPASESFIVTSAQDKPVEDAPADTTAEVVQQTQPVTSEPVAVEAQAEQAITSTQRITPQLITQPPSVQSAEQTADDQPIAQTVTEPAPVALQKTAPIDETSVPPTESDVTEPVLPVVVEQRPAQTISSEPAQVEAPAETPTETVTSETDTGVDAGLTDCGDLAQRSQLELDKLQVYVVEVNKRLEKLRKELNEGEQKRRQQAVLIDFFEQELQSLRKRNPEYSELVNAAFSELSAQLPESPVFRVEENRLIIMTDFVLVFGRGEVSTAGETRLQLIANALRHVATTMPVDVNWRWRVEGHSDSQPLRSITWFPSNWELSAARAAGIARYLIDQGVSAERIRVAALGATKPIEPDAETKDEHWRNRRVEIHLSLERG